MGFDTWFSQRAIESSNGMRLKLEMQPQGKEEDYNHQQVGLNGQMGPGSCPWAGSRTPGVDKHSGPARILQL